MNSEDDLPVTPSSGPRGRFAAVYRVLSDAIAAQAFPGCAFGVLAGGEVVLQTRWAASPMTKLRPPSRRRLSSTSPASPRSSPPPPLRCYSISAACSTSRRPWAICFPASCRDRAADDPARRIAVSHLLAHSSGLPGYVDFFRTAATPEALLESLPAALPSKPNPARAPSTPIPASSCWARPWRAFTREPLAAWTPREILQPLGLAATCFSPPPSARASIPPTEEDTTFRHRRHSGRSSGRKRLAAWRRSRSCRAFLPRAGPAALCPRDSRRLPTPDAARLFDAATVELFAQRQGPTGSSARAGLGYAFSRFHLRPSLLAAFDRTPGLQRLLPVDRPGSPSRRRVAQQPHLARPQEPPDPPGLARLSRRHPRSAVRLLQSAPCFIR